MHPENVRALSGLDKPLEHALSLACKALEAEPFLDVQLAELFIGRNPGEALNQPTALRILEVLDRSSTGTRLAHAIGQLLMYGRPLIRCKAAMRIARGTGNFDWIYAQLAKADPRTRANMLEALCENRSAECLKAFSVYRDDTDNRVAGSALYGLYLCGEADAIPSVTRMASHPDPKFRATAAWLMGNIGEAQFADVLRTMVQDASRSVKGSALKALVRLNRAAGSAKSADSETAVGMAPAGPRRPRPDSYFVSWKPQYSVHIDAIDRQHQGLIALTRQLQEAMWEARGRDFQATLIDRLVAYTNEHLRFEEDMLRERGYEPLAQHAEQHRALTSQVCELQQKVHSGEALSNASVLLFLRNWFTDHIMQQDQKYARALRIAAEAVPPPASPEVV
jgi:hemerythrin-like metal-binding protein